MGSLLRVPDPTLPTDENGVGDENDVGDNIPTIASLYCLNWCFFGNGWCWPVPLATAGSCTAIYVWFALHSFACVMKPHASAIFEIECNDTWKTGAGWVRESHDVYGWLWNGIGYVAAAVEVVVNARFGY